MSFTRDLQARVLAETESTWWGLAGLHGGTLAAEVLNEAQTLADGNIIFCGSTKNLGPATGRNIFILKLTELGEFIWARSFGEASSSTQRCLITDNESIILAGTNTSPAGVFLLKLSPDGVVEWAKLISNSVITPFIYGLSFQNSNNILLAGHTWNTDKDNAMLVSFDINDGALLWAKYIGAGAVSSKAASYVDSDGNIFLTGTASTSLISAFITKLDASGNHLWSRTIGKASHALVGISTILDQHSNIINAGHHQKPSSLGNGFDERKIYLCNLTADGTYNWGKFFGEDIDADRFTITVNTIHATSLTLDHDNFAVLVGRTGIDPLHDIFIARFDHAGALLNIKTISSAAGDAAYSVKILHDGRMVISGWSKAFGESSPGGFVAMLNQSAGLNISVEYPLTSNDHSFPISSLSSSNIGTWSPSITSFTPTYSDWTTISGQNLTSEVYTRYDFIGVTATASASATASMTPSQSASPTASTSPSHSASFSASSTASGSSSASASASSTSSNTATPSATLTNTPSATLSATRSSTLTSTSSGSSSATHSATVSMTPTRTASPSASASESSSTSSSVSGSTSTTATSSNTASPSTSLSTSTSSSHTATLSSTTTTSATASVTASSSASNTGSSSLTASPSSTTTSSGSTSTSITASTSPSVSPTQSSSTSLSASTSSTATPSASLTASASSSSTPSPTATQSDTSSFSASKSTTPTASSSVSATSSASPSATTSSSPSLSTTASVTASTSRTPSITQSTSHSDTSTASVTPSLSPSHSVTPSSTASTTASSSISNTTTMSSSSSVSATSTASQSPSAVFSTSSSATDTASMSASASASASATPSPSYTAPASINPSLSASPSTSSSTNLDDALQEASSSNNTMIIIGAVVIVGVVAATAFFLWRCHANKTKHRRLVSPSKRPTSPTSTPNLWTSAAGDNNARPISPPSSAVGEPARPARQPHHRRRKKHRKRQRQPRRMDSHSVRVKVPSR